MRTRKGGLVLMMALAALSFGPAGIAEQPTADQKRLDYFVGKWRVELDIKAQSTVPASKASGTEDCESYANMHVVCRADLTATTGRYKSMRIISYVPMIKQYAHYTVDSMGFAVLTMGQVQGDSWTFNTELGGIKIRSTVKTSGDSYTTAGEFAGPDGRWVPTSTAKSTRVK